MKRKLVNFVSLVALTVGATYFVPEMITSLYFIGILAVYFRSKNEPFWLAFFLVLNDGFFGFFGAFEASLAAIPGLPPVEVIQIYILLSVVKARMRKPAFGPFYRTHLIILGIYLAFLVIQGRVLGLSSALNVQFRVFKDIVPLLAFYSIPKLFDSRKSYEECFGYLFVVAAVAFVAQVMTIFLSQSPPMFFGVDNALNVFDVQIDARNTYRGFFNANIVLITLFGATFYLAKKPKVFPPVICYLIIAANFLIAFLSASRGWTLFFLMVIVLYFFFVEKIRLKKLFSFSIISLLLLGVALFAPVIRTQVGNSIKRLQTLNALKGGDITAGGTLLRLSMRGPRVMKQWEGSPLTGWGFSDHYYRFRDGHVGNQNILLHAGVIGFFLLALFFGYFLLKLCYLSIRLPSGHPDKKALLVFIVFFLGWFFLHSAGGQQFGFENEPSKGLIQALFFSLGALVFRTALKGQKNTLLTESRKDGRKEITEQPVLES